jgi:hypothetical protein
VNRETTRNDLKQHLEDGFLMHEFVCSPRVVFPQSQLRVRRAVETLARYFRREFSYDFIQYCATDEKKGSKDRALLWVEHKLAIGAACLRWRKRKDGTPCYALAWVRFHPFERRRGHLSSAWPLIRKHFSPLAIEPPFSPSMKAFLERHNESFEENTKVLQPRMEPTKDFEEPFAVVAE